MGKSRKAIKHRKRRTPLATSSPKPNRRLLSKPAWIIGAIASVAVVIGIYLYPEGPDKTTIESAPLDINEPSIARRTLTPREEMDALKKEEIEIADMVMKDFPDTEDALEIMGNLHSRHGRRNEAAQYWQKCLEKTPRRLSVYRSLAIVAIDAGEYEEAIEHLAKAVAINPNEPRIHEKMGHALVESGRYDRAIEELEKEISIQPESPLAHFLLGQAFSKQQAYEKARAHYEKAIELNPKYANACYALARVYGKLKQPEKAAEYQAKFREFRSEENQEAYEDRNTRTVADLGSLRSSAVQVLLDAERLYRAAGNFPKCETLLRRAVAIDPKNAKCFEKLGSLYNMTNRLPEAIDQFERMSRIDPSNIYCYLNIGRISARLKRYDDAEKAYLKAISINQNQSPGYSELARLYLTKNANLEQARRFAQKALAIDASAENYFVLSWACDVNGDRTEALDAIKEAIRLQPKNPKYRQIYERIKSAN